MIKVIRTTTRSMQDGESNTSQSTRLEVCYDDDSGMIIALKPAGFDNKGFLVSTDESGNRGYHISLDEAGEIHEWLGEQLKTQEVYK